MAQQSAIDSVLKEKEFEEGDNEDKCPICLVKFNPKETICVLPCQHRYHRSCVEQWLRDRERSATCPLCRHNVFGGAQLATASQRLEARQFQDGVIHVEPIPSRPPRPRRPVPEYLMDS